LPLAALGRFLYRTGKLEEARIRLTEAVALEPDTPAVHVDLGVTALKQENFDEALAQFETALRLQPEWPELRAFVEEVRKKRDAGQAKDRKQ
jgi:Flp pilus assembly protein TadD